MNDDFIITYLLGYLKPEQWNDALKVRPQDKEAILNLIAEQENAFNFDLKSDIDALNESEDLLGADAEDYDAVLKDIRDRQYPQM